MFSKTGLLQSLSRCRNHVVKYIFFSSDSVFCLAPTLNIY